MRVFSAKLPTFHSPVLELPKIRVISGSYFLYYRDQKLSLLPGRNYTIGRSDTDVVLPHGLVSRDHAEIIWQGGQFWIVDHGSRNGTQVNGRSIEKQALSHGSRIKIGCFDLEFIAASGDVSDDADHTLVPSETIQLERRLSRFVGEIEDPDIVKGFYELKELYDRKKDMLTDFAYKDPLTGLYNRRFFEKRMEAELARCLRFSQQLQFVMLDMDHFKDINDTHGHPKGDEVLKTVAGVLMTNSRQTDIPVRYGGEELLLVLPETSAQQAFGVAEKIRVAVEQETVRENGIAATVSIGIAGFSEVNDSVEKLILSADRMLYVAKMEGRNRTIVES